MPGVCAKLPGLKLLNRKWDKGGTFKKIEIITDLLINLGQVPESAMSPVGKNIKILIKVDLLYYQWLLCRDRIFDDDINIIWEFIDVSENYKSTMLLLCVMEISWLKVCV